MSSSSSFSGTAVAGSGTIADLIARCLVFLNDEGGATWDTEMIGSFLNDAIRDYSQHFPRARQSTISLVTGTNEYDLPDDFQGALSVEYPAGQDPPVYLQRRPYTAIPFWKNADYYDILRLSDGDNADQLWLAADPSSGETAVVVYLGHHQLLANPAAPTGDNTVPPQHQQLLIKYVQWQAALHLAAAEQQNPTSNSSLLMAQLAQNARRLELSYHTAVQQAVYAAEGDSRVAEWAGRGTEMERIY